MSTTRRRKSRAIVQTRDAVPFVRTGGAATFDDRNVVSFVSQSIEYPSMVPSSYRTDCAVENYAPIDSLYASGSIVVTRTTLSGLYDSALYDAIAEERNARQT